MKTTRINRLAFVFTTICIVLFACAKDEGPFVKKITQNPPPNDTVPKNPNDTIPNPIPEPTVFPYTIRFGADIKPLFQASCISGCHNMHHPKLDLRPPVAYNQLLSNGSSAPYVNVSTPKHSILYLHLVGVYTLMPKNGQKLPQGQIDTVFTWISQGALNN